jgi:tetratricopeptide (TPR) repeat protein
MELKCFNCGINLYQKIERDNLTRSRNINITSGNRTYVKIKNKNNENSTYSYENDIFTVNIYYEENYYTNNEDSIKNTQISIIEDAFNCFNTIIKIPVMVTLSEQEVNGLKENSNVTYNKININFFTDDRYAIYDYVDDEIKFNDKPFNQYTLGAAGPYYIQYKTQNDGNIRQNIFPLTGDICINTALINNMIKNNINIGNGMGNKKEYFVVLIHEICHILGIGTIWMDPQISDQSSFIKKNTNDETYYYMGDNSKALEMYKKSINNSYVSNNIKGIPIENNGGSGTKLGHFEEGTTVFGEEKSYDNRYYGIHFQPSLDKELMTGQSERSDDYVELSLITVGTLDDFGYIIKDGVYSKNFDVANNQFKDYISYTYSPSIPDNVFNKNVISFYTGIDNINGFKTTLKEQNKITIYISNNIKINNVSNNVEAISKFKSLFKDVTGLSGSSENNNRFIIEMDSTSLKNLNDTLSGNLSLI